MPADSGRGTELRENRVLSELHPSQGPRMGAQGLGQELPAQTVLSHGPNLSISSLQGTPQYWDLTGAEAARQSPRAHPPLPPPAPLQGRRVQNWVPILWPVEKGRRGGAQVRPPAGKRELWARRADPRASCREQAPAFPSVKCFTWIPPINPPRRGSYKDARLQIRK